MERHQNVDVGAGAGAIAGAVGVADPGVGGLSATGHLVSALETTQVGHVST